MKALLFFINLILTLWRLDEVSSSSAETTETFTRHIALDSKGKLDLWWRTNSHGIIFRYVVKEFTLGHYAALGFSHKGGMVNSDIIIIKLKSDGNIELVDAYSYNNTLPQTDDQQNVQILSSRQNGTMVEIVFQRYESCDPMDVLIMKNLPINAIWALGQLDNDQNIPKYHNINRGQRSINFYAPDVNFENDEKYVDILAPDVRIPENTRTYYYCRILRLPNFNRPVHAVGFRGLIREGNEALVHHMILYECTVPDWRLGAFEDYVQTHNGTQCYSPNMPVDWGRCGHILAVWAVGGAGERLPEDAGIPLQKENGQTPYYMLEIHYDNPLLNNTLVDSSGIRLYYTETLRRYEAGLLNVGHDISPIQMIPPRQALYTSVGVCGDACSSSLPASGIYIYSVLLHSHLAGVRMRLRHILANGSETAPIAEDLAYNFNYQQARNLLVPVKMMPGDQLAVECHYNTANRQNMTFGGISVQNEMCLAFISYYPRTSLSICWSSPDLGGALSQLGLVSTNAYGMEVEVREAGDMVQRVINNLDSFARAQWDMDSPLPHFGDKNNDETNRHLYQIALQDQKIMNKLKADNLTALEAIGMDYLPEPLQNPYLILKDILVINPSRYRMNTLFQFLLEHKWDSESVRRLQRSTLSRFRSKCVLRNGSVVNMPAQPLSFAPNTRHINDRCSRHLIADSGGVAAAFLLSPVTSATMLLLVALIGVNSW